MSKTVLIFQKYEDDSHYITEVLLAPDVPDHAKYLEELKVAFTRERAAIRAILTKNGIRHTEKRIRDYMNLRYNYDDWKSFLIAHGFERIDWQET